ncbi:DUF4233 domain-containing protein [Microbacterium thalassium]|uniref:Putative phage tail protein n=1 Tax=Microbacterium thalassium TaxID=362649 RepID=A0A7X0FQV5_9MICO|nr:DUF4233 domain-containing protein [Microbacterium thalassium]MBB6392038.1 putative phage tail protein [Microbacterium thalassium]GLK25002.1 hypothetical protein GCM10017607_23200 [Microbacterium thalassium]
MSDAAAPRRRRQRGARESLASIVLAFESVIAFLGGLTVYGLRALPDGIEPWWGIVAGAVVGAAMIIVSGLVRHTWGIVLGWVLQALVALGGFFVPALFLVAIVFGGMYAYATIKGASLDRRNAQLAADNPNGE